MVQIDTGSGRNKNRGPRKPTTEIDSELNHMMLESTLKVVSGVVKDAEMFKMARLTFRASRGKIAFYTKPVGNIYSRFVDGPSNERVSVYMMVFQTSDEMMSKVERICDGFSRIKYDLECAFNHEERELKIKKVDELIRTQT